MWFNSGWLPGNMPGSIFKRILASTRNHRPVTTQTEKPGGSLERPVLLPKAELQILGFHFFAFSYDKIIIIHIQHTEAGRRVDFLLTQHLGGRIRRIRKSKPALATY